ncbi:hypothetical protein KUT41_23815 [Pseudomonas aeruginosa]|uniref:Uncharacterized protein n=1 Tax=Pseudomonas aeruginosa TaxID=287 RepID=A0A0N9ZX55_PSEAI|nr:MULTISPECIES: hypothetical protein [Pseudomonas]MED5477544.1 hypothetical protein [Pseudomonadota bacterium]SSU86471.1 Uncharacterised protein [Acinetobacter baumannii]ALI58743.1 hypothetical protein CCBH4851_00037 [Pseudomonas aeruginosa]AOX26859.1 hypothetical protein PA1088_02740 [Pseudomonas aeruginosa]AOX33170.1 hypothetical protein PA8281_06130 [Pseudomonas aeruginosa]
MKIIDGKFIFEVGDPVIDHADTKRRVGLIIVIEEDESGEKVLVVEAEGHPGQIWRILDKDATLP